MNRNSPTVALLNSGYGSIGADSPYFFFDKLIVGASNGFVGQIKEVKLSIGGINIPLTATTTAGVYISGEADTSTLTPGENILLLWSLKIFMAGKPRKVRKYFMPQLP